MNLAWLRPRIAPPVFASFVTLPILLESGDRVLRGEVVVEAPLDQVWEGNHPPTPERDAPTLGRTLVVERS